MIKINGLLIPFGRWYYHNYIKSLGKNEFVKYKDFDQTNCDPDNLYASREKSISKEERRNGLALLARKEKNILKDLSKCDTRAKEAKIMKELAGIRKLIKHFSASKRYPVNNSVAKPIERDIDHTSTFGIAI